MRYINSNDYFQKAKNPKTYSIKEALLTGQAPDKGLYVPEKFIHYDIKTIRSFKNQSYADIAFNVLYPYFDEIPEKDFSRIVHNTYDNIQAPIIELYDNIYILELFHNWTFAFKDFAAQLLASVIEYYLKKSKKKTIVFVGTSGDTGPAIDEAFWKKENLIVYCLFPKNGVTETQRKQMTTLGENIYPIEVDGDFHTCQEMAKSALDDDDLKKFNPTSANSINWGRFIPQAVFSFWLYSQIAEYDEPIIISIPTGNAGHIGSNFLAQKDIGGLPIEKFIAPHNLNNYLVRMLEENKNEVEVFDTYNCLSNAMNVKLPNNIPRILYLFKNNIKKMQELIYPVTIDDDKTVQVIKKVYKEKNYLLDVHSAVALAGVFEFLENNPEYKKYKIGAYLTAHPAKFSDKIEKVMGFSPEMPEKLKSQENMPEKNVHSLDANDMKGLKEIVCETQRC
ncbi:MAG: threonine synthase [Spirochaetes bacterium]|nr:threonine synthase [Spirochaetota bacterium]